jgi:hypothetical protein
MVGERRNLEAGVASRGPASAQAVGGAGTIEAEPCMFFCQQPAAVASSSKQSEPCEADACKVGSAVRKGNLVTKLRRSRALCEVFSKQLQGPLLATRVQAGSGLVGRLGAVKRVGPEYRNLFLQQSFSRQSNRQDPVLRNPCARCENSSDRCGLIFQLALRL